MARVELTPAAALDVGEAARWYEAQRQGLGEASVYAVRRAQHGLAEHPQPGTPLHRTVRRALIGRFPYGVFYRYVAEDDRVLVLAVTHLHRDPVAWKRRS